MPYCCGYYYPKGTKCSKCDGNKTTECKNQQEGTSEAHYDFIKADPMPPYCLEWLNQRGLSEEDIAKHGLFYAWHLLVNGFMYTSRLVIPVLREDRTFEFFQARSLFNEEPKYISPKGVKEYWKSEHKENNTISIVEDAISAMRISKYANVVALLGNSLTDSLIGATLLKYDHVKVWLDNDAGGFAGICRILENYNGWFESIEIISSDKEPKWCSDDELQEIINVK